MDVKVSTDLLNEVHEDEDRYKVDTFFNLCVLIFQVADEILDKEGLEHTCGLAEKNEKGGAKPV